MKGIILGIRKRPWAALVCFFAAFSVIWTLIEGLSHLITGLEIRGAPVLAVVALIGIGYSLYTIRRPAEIAFDITHTNTRIQIRHSMFRTRSR